MPCGRWEEELGFTQSKELFSSLLVLLLLFSLFPSLLFSSRRFSLLIFVLAIELRWMQQRKTGEESKLGPSITMHCILKKLGGIETTNDLSLDAWLNFSVEVVFERQLEFFRYQKRNDPLSMRNLLRYVIAEVQEFTRISKIALCQILRTKFGNSDLMILHRVFTMVAQKPPSH